MAFSHGSTAKVLVNGYDLTGYLRQLTVAGVADVAETSAFGSTSKSYIPGLKDATLTAAGMYDPASGGSDVVLAAALGAGTSIWTHLPAGDVVGNRGRGLSGIDTEYQVNSPVDGVNEATAACQSSKGFQPVICHQPLTAVTGGGTAGTVVDNGALTTNGGVGFLQMTSLTGGTAVVKIQHAAVSTYADLITFTSVLVAGVPTAERVAVAGTVNRNTRATWTVTGGTATFQATFGRA